MGRTRWMRTVILLGTGTVLLLALRPAGTGAQSPAGAPDTTPAQTTGWIAYASPDGKLWAMRGDGTDKRLLVADLQQVGRPTWSNDNRYLAFTAINAAGQRCLYTYAVATGATKELTCGFSPLWTPDWSPNDGRIVFLGTQAGTSGLRNWALNADGTALQQIGAGVTPEVCPVWANADAIAYPGMGADGKWRLYRALFGNPAAPVALSPDYGCFGCADMANVWWADARTDTGEILYLAGERGCSILPPGCNGYVRLWSVNVTGVPAPVQVCQVAHSGSFLNGTLYRGSLSISPDKTRVAAWGGTDEEAYHAVVCDLAGHRKITDLPPLAGAYGFIVDWSPDGTRLLAQGDAPSGTGDAVYSISSTGGNYQYLADGYDPDWGNPAIEPRAVPTTPPPAVTSVTPTPTATATATPTPPATITATASPTHPATPTLSPTPGNTPVVTRAPTRPLPTPEGAWCGGPGPAPSVCPRLRALVPAAVLDDAIAQPTGVMGWNQRLNPGAAFHPVFNPCRTSLNLQDYGKPYHVLQNRVVYEVGCR